MKRVSGVVVVFSSDKLFIQLFLSKSINFSVHYEYVLKPVGLLDLSVLSARERMKFSLYTVSVNGLVNSFLASGDFVVC